MSAERPESSLRHDAGLPTAELLTARVTRDAVATVVDVDGEIDLYTIDTLHTALAEAVTAGATLVVVDLADVRFMSSIGVSALLSALQQAELLGCQLRLAAGRQAVHLPMRLTGTDQLFEHYPSVADATRQPLTHL